MKQMFIGGGIGLVLTPVFVVVGLAMSRETNVVFRFLFPSSLVGEGLIYLQYVVYGAYLGWEYKRKKTERGLMVIGAVHMILFLIIVLIERFHL